MTVEFLSRSGTLPVYETISVRAVSAALAIGGAIILIIVPTTSSRRAESKIATGIAPR